MGNETVFGWERVGQEDGVMKRIRGAWIDGIGGEDEDYHDERIDPCMPERERFPSPQDRLRFPSFGKRPRGFCLRIPLKKGSVQL